MQIRVPTLVVLHTTSYQLATMPREKNSVGLLWHNALQEWPTGVSKVADLTANKAWQTI